MAGGGKLAWYAKRLARMSPPELAHRVIERSKQFRDARRRFSWDAFHFAGAIKPLAAFDLGRAIASLTPEVEERARAVLEGDIRLLSAEWPEQAKREWWRTDLWTLDPESGKHWPGRGAAASKSVYRHAHGFGDVKFVWELSRLQYLLPLAVAARRDRDARLAAEIADIVDGWMENNPPYDGINWTNGIEAATRVIVALVLNTLLADFSPPAFQERLRAFLAAHVWMLARYPSLFSSANNHRVAELTALYLAYAHAPGLPNATRGQAHEKRELEREVAKQFHPDGIGAEQSPTYAAYSLEWFLLAAICSGAAGDAFPPAYFARLSNAAIALRWMMDDAGRTPAIGDDDEGRVVALGARENYLYPAAICASVARLLGPGDYAPPPQSPTLLDSFIAGETPPTSALHGSRTFADGGYSVWRTPSSRGTLLTVFDHAPLGFLSIAAHGHADALSVWLHVGGEPLLIDAGTYLYHTEGGGRASFRGTLAHNTVAIAGADQSTIAGPFNWSRHAITKRRDAADGTVSASHDGYLADYGVTPVRSLHVDGDIEITDALEGAIETPTRWSAGFTFHPRVMLALTETGVDARLPSGAKATLRIGFVNSGALTLENVSVSTGFGRLEQAKRLVMSGEAQRPGVIATTTIELD